MSGFLEILKAQVEQHEATIGQLVAAVQELRAQQPVAQVVQQPAQAAGLGMGLIGVQASNVAASSLGGGLGAGLGGGLSAAQQPTTPVTGEMITALVTQYIDNNAVKEAFKAQMAQMGIQELPNTQPHQYAELYQRFQAVIAQGVAANPGAGAVGGGNPII